MTLILLRHGVTEANERHLYCGFTDLPLSEGGRRALLQRKDSPPPLPKTEGFRIVTSGMKRCEETLTLLFGPTPHETEPAFREMNFGAFEMRSYEELKEDAAYLAWISGDNDRNRTPGGESGHAMTNRVLAAWEKLQRDGRDTLLVTHGGVIAALMAHFFPEENKNRYQWQSSPGGGYVIEEDGRRYERF